MSRQRKLSTDNVSKKAISKFQNNSAERRANRSISNSVVDVYVIGMQYVENGRKFASHGTISKLQDSLGNVLHVSIATMYFLAWKIQ